MARNPLTGSRNWVRSGFALFWILLGCVSGVYLFSVLTGPTLGKQTAGLSPDSQASQSPDQELAAIQESLQALSQKVAGLSDRLEDGEPSTTPMPSEQPANLPQASLPTVAPPALSTAETTPAPAPAMSAREEPSGAQADMPEAPPIEQAAAEPQAIPNPAPPPAPPPQRPPEPPAVVISPLDEPPAELEAASRAEQAQAPAQAAPQQTQPAAPAVPQQAPVVPQQAQPAAPAPPAAGPAAAENPQPPPPQAPPATETAALDPIALPPAANDGSTRYGIEIGIVENRDKLRPLWREFLTNHAALVAGLQPRRVLAPDKKWRLIAGPFSSAAEAEQACGLFKKASRPCEATVYAGDAL
jgi:SPOR domain